MRLLAGLAFMVLAAAADARTIVTNVNGYTLDEVGRLIRFAGLAIGDDGRVERLLNAGEAAPDGDIVDAGGKTLLPGFIDAHGHVMELGYQALQVDLTGTKSLEEALAKIAAYARENPDRKWITGGGWNDVSWGLGRLPTADDLDQAVADRPVLLGRVDGHADWANTAALKLARVDKSTADSAGGRIERDAEGNPTGVFVDAARALVADKVPPPSAEEAEAALTKALRIIASVGLTGVHAAGIDKATWPLLNRFAEEGRLTARIAAMAGGMETLNALAPKGPTGWLHDDRLALNSVKLYGDGALGSRGAALAEPYSDDPGNTGLLFFDGAKLRNMIVSAAMRGFQVNVHAIGDKANREVLNAFADVARMGVSGTRNRIEHAQVVAIEDITRFAKIGVIASVQPTHATSDKAMAEDRVGPERIKGAYAWASLAGAGARLAGGSDFPVEPANPFYGLHAAVTRRDREGNPPGGWYANEALTRLQAFAAFTIGAAYAGQQERTVGTLAPGKWADFVLVDRDIFEVQADDLWKTVVEETWLAGKRVFARE